jgi:hypothetical protein
LVFDKLHLRKIDVDAEFINLFEAAGLETGVNPIAYYLAQYARETEEDDETAVGLAITN